MKLFIIIIVLFLATKGATQSVGSWTQWTQWSDCPGCEGTQESTANCVVDGDTGCYEGATRYRSKGCGGSCPVCMNSIVESGEECDCGIEEECDDNCCDAVRCIWRTGIECTSGECCDKQTCYYKPSFEACRESADECDFAEYCSGNSDSCPEDVYKANTTSCNNNQNYCFSGRCQNSDTLCRYLYGENAKSYTECYDYNRGGTVYGNCGESGSQGDNTYTPCSREDIRCGTLQCVNTAELIHASEYNSVSNRNITIIDGLNTFTCRSVYAVKSATGEIVGYVQDGTVCGTEKVCLNKHCVAVSSIEFPNCPIGTNGQVCSGQGECNQNMECVCNNGFTGLECGQTVTAAVWSEWSVWEECSLSCGSGTRTRTRTCESSNCVGMSSESGTCNEDTCQSTVNGGWSSWSSFSPCSKSCGSGLTVLYRTCNNPVPSNGGKECVGQPNKVLYCNTHPCGTDGEWSNWESWSECSVECGTGTRTRTRRCDSPEPSGGGEDCAGELEENENCNIHTCAVPVDGGWDEWSNWTPCTVTCGGGTIRRSRECINPSPSGGGVNCVGESQQTDACNEDNCPGIVQWTGWTEWTPCDVTCGVSVESRSRNRECEQFTECSEEETRMCNRIPCVLYTAGGWGDWTEWTECSQTCGEGQKSRSRACDNPIKGVLGPDCVGLNSDTQVCTLNNCPGEVVAGGWGAWTGWTECSETCGSGVRRRERACDSPLPVNGGLECGGDSEQLKACTLNECVVDGGWGEWSTYGDCTQSCGGGVRTRSRGCDSPVRSGSGLDCVGSGLDFVNCNQQSCDIVTWGIWGEWSNCVGTCDKGEKRRERECNDPSPTGTIACPGDSIATKECELDPCIVNGTWGEWSGWTECTQTCDSTEEQTRTRRCDNPAPSTGGSFCSGDDTQSQLCDQTGCQECVLSTYRIASTCSLPCDTNSGISYSVRCVTSGDVNNCQKKTHVDRSCRNKLCTQQSSINMSNECFIWMDLETLEPQCGTETEMVTSINRKLYCSQSRILDLSTRDLNLSFVGFSCILHSGSCVRQDN